MPRAWKVISDHNYQVRATDENDGREMPSHRILFALQLDRKYYKIALHYSFFSISDMKKVMKSEAVPVSFFLSDGTRMSWEFCLSKLIVRMCVQRPS